MLHILYYRDIYHICEITLRLLFSCMLHEYIIIKRQYPLNYIQTIKNTLNGQQISDSNLQYWTQREPVVPVLFPLAQ